MHGFVVCVLNFYIQFLPIHVILFVFGVFFAKLQPAVAGSMIGVRLGLAEHIQDSNAIFSLSLDDEDVNSIQEISGKGKDLVRVIGDCGDEYRRA